MSIKKAKVTEMKRSIAMILAAVIVLAALAACGSPENAEDDGMQTLYVYDTYGHSTMTAIFSSSTSDLTMTAEMKMIDEKSDGKVFSCKADPTVYDRVIFNNGDRDTPMMVYNEYVSGWALTPLHIKPYQHGTEGTEVAEPEYKRQSFPYEDMTKDVLIWTPKDYDADSAEKYSVIYMTDGQNLFKDNATTHGSWNVAESIENMMAVNGSKVIVVGIENADSYRDMELTPNLGTPTDGNYEDGRGAYFADFVYNTVVPYVEKNYNVYTDREHNAVCGSSSGGIECFYIGMEHPEKFGTIGALSPAFVLYDDATWYKYLKEKDFSAGYPDIYIFNGGGDDLERTLQIGAKAMPEYLKKIDYPTDKVTFKLDDSAMHNEEYWRFYFPEFLKILYPVKEAEQKD